MLGWTLGVACAFTGAVFGHGDGPTPPVPPQAGAMVDAQVIYPERWSWLHWWEANRDLYLHPVRQGGPLQDRDQAAYLALRKRAVETLIEQMHSGADVERAAAVLALGRVGDAQSPEHLERLIKDDPSEAVRANAILALGLLRTAEMEKFLTQVQFPNTNLRRTGLAAIGLMESPSAQSMGGLRTSVLGDEPASASIAAWSLRRHPAGENGSTLHRVLSASGSPWLCSEAILALGDMGDAGSLGVLIDVLEGGQRAGRVPAWASLAALDQNKNWLSTFGKVQGATYKARYEQYLQQVQVYRHYNPNWRAAPMGATVIGTVVIGPEKIAMSRLRGSAAIALAKFTHPQSVRALMAAVREADNPYNELPKGLAVMSLGQIGSPDSLGLLLDVLGPADRRNRVAMERPLRGYAALALGLYARQVQTAQGPSDRPATAKVLERLGERLADTGETQEVRCASAVALGLSRRSSGIKALASIAPKLTVRDELVGGYTLLARGMLGDRNIVGLCRNFLRLENDKADMPGILSRRAAVLGLGLCGADEAIPVLTEAWHLNYYVNREVILALALGGAYSVAGRVIDEVHGKTTPPERAFFAGVLGELFARERPSPIAYFVLGSNYTLKDESRLPCQRLANEFLQGYLIPSFGEAWR